MNTADVEARARIRQFMPPLMIMLVCIPLVLRLIPRNGMYGIRVREAFASDASWYTINQLESIAFIGACLVWMAVSHGLNIVYPLTNEPWGVRRFFVTDPNGIVINVMCHIGGGHSD
jgi:SdpI/YfhL protein family